MGYLIHGRDDFAINGVSARTFGLVVDSLQPPPMAQQGYAVYSVGLDSTYTVPDDTYADVEYHIPARVLCRPDDFDNSRIYAFLQGAETITISKIAGKFFKVRQVLGITPSAAYRGQEVTYDIAFMLAPFKYHTKNPTVVMDDPEITNPGTRYSRPLYKVTHSGSGCSLVVNGQICKIQPWTDKNGLTTYPPSPIWIDAERMVAYSMSGTSKINATKYTDGAYPFLHPGVNAAYTTGTGLEITGNWRDY